MTHLKFKIPINIKGTEPQEMSNSPIFVKVYDDFREPVQRLSKTKYDFNDSTTAPKMLYTQVCMCFG